MKVQRSRRSEKVFKDLLLSNAVSLLCEEVAGKNKSIG